MTLSADDIKGYLRNNFGIDPPTIVFADSLYTCPTPQWFFGEFAAKLEDFWRGARPRVPWWQGLFRRDTWDCDDYARMAAVVAQILHRESGEPGARAVGEFWYYRKANPADEHAIVIGVFSPTDIGFLEPQTRTRSRLRPDEKSTYARF